MKKVLVSALGLFIAAAFVVNAADAPQQGKRQLTDEQKKLQKEMLAKYDANKDGRLDWEERAKISAEDKEKLSKAGLGGQRNQKGQEKK